MQVGGDGDIWAVYDAIIKDYFISELTEGFYVAFKEGAEGVKGRQDQLFKQVPEPATMMLLGVRLLGLGIVNRRKTIK